jgi:hypothetical protein
MNPTITVIEALEGDALKKIGNSSERTLVLKQLMDRGHLKP